MDCSVLLIPSLPLNFPLQAMNTASEWIVFVSTIFFSVDSAHKFTSFEELVLNRFRKKMRPVHKTKPT